jgi:hypothetical protein
MLKSHCSYKHYAYIWGMILNKTKEPMTNNSSQVQVGEVFFTRDLSKFVTMNGNRVTNPKHVERIALSQEQNGVLMNPIIVNSLWEVVDGQHRLEASKLNGVGVYYIVAPNYSLDEVHALNLNQKNWGSKDYLQGYADMGLKQYVKLQSFMLENPEFSIAISISICDAKTYDSGSYTRQFNSGEWQAGDFKAAQKNADKLKLIGSIYEGFNRRSFVAAMLTIFSNKNFDFNEFMHKLRLQPNALVDCVSVTQYKVLIEDIYNYRRREKVSLKY